MTSSTKRAASSAQARTETAVATWRAAAVGAAAIWALSRVVLYLLSMGGVRRHHVESGWFIFIAAILIAAISKRANAETLTPVGPGRPPIHLLAVFVTASFALYSPILRIGFLSDDFALSALASRGAVLDPSYEFVRPLPLAIWSLVHFLVPGGLVPIALHALNVVLHGVNAWLVAMLAQTLTRNAARAALAGVLFLTMPLVEPVVWISGVFDVLLLTWCLAAVLLLTTSNAWRTAGSIALACGAVLTKETGVVLGALLGAVLLARRDLRTAANARLVAIVLAIGGIYLVIRVSLGLPANHMSPLSGYQLKELLVRPFATLGLPVHGELLNRVRVIAVMWAVILIALVWLNARHWHRSAPDFRVALGSCGWILASVAPLLAMFFIGDDLQGARYVYLAYAAWAVLLSVLVMPSDRTTWPACALPVAAAIVSALLAYSHLAPWQRAAATRDQVLERYAPFSGICPASAVRGLPDNVAGAFVFRNGFEQASSSSTAGSRPPAPDCTLEWKDGAFIRTR